MKNLFPAKRQMKIDSYVGREGSLGRDFFGTASKRREQGYEREKEYLSAFCCSDSSGLFWAANHPVLFGIREQRCDDSDFWRCVLVFFGNLNYGWVWRFDTSDAVRACGWDDFPAFVRGYYGNIAGGSDVFYHQ